MRRLDTVEVVAGENYAVDTRLINAEDFDPSVHKRAGDEEAEVDEDPEVDWEITDNGWWTITYGGEEITGRGEEELNQTLEEMGIVR